MCGTNFPQFFSFIHLKFSRFSQNKVLLVMLVQATLLK
jgi:hypothetical protein